MELFALLLLGVAIVSFVSKHSPRKNNSKNRSRSHRWGANLKRQPFDSKSTKPQNGMHVLNGRAYVVDGDTIVIRNTQIRLFGIDAPEINHPFGKKAKWELVSLCKGQTIQAEITEQDEYGRTVAKCYLPDGRDVSAEMVKLGLAIDWPKFSGGKYQAMELAGVRKKLWLADARQKGRMHILEQFEAKQNSHTSNTEY